MIKGNIVGLRAIEKEDLQQLLAWRNNTENRQYFREWRELNMVHQYKWFENHVMSSTSPIMFSITKIEDNTLLGVCGLTYIDWVHRIAEISIYIGDGYIDETYAPEALKLLYSYAFNTIGLHKVWMAMYEYDIKKYNLAINCGFTKEGLFREVHFEGGKWHDEYLFGKLENEI